MKEKQIKEMEEIGSKHPCDREDCSKCLAMNRRCNDFLFAERLYNAGYRKADEVAREIFEEIEHTAKAAIILLKFEKDEKIRNIKTECYTDLIDYISKFKEKYTEEK